MTSSVVHHSPSLPRGWHPVHLAQMWSLLLGHGSSEVRPPQVPCRLLNCRQISRHWPPGPWLQL